jgi:dTDP-4-dehydrorhamnose reductase
MLLVKLLIIGASGFIGRRLYAEALARGHTVLGTQSSGKYDNYYSFNLASDRIGDVLPPDFLPKKDEIPCAVICSAISKIEFCSTHRELTYEVNVTNTIRLLQDLRGFGIKTAYLSSDAVFDGHRGYYDETAACAPVNAYGRHKAEVEQYMLKHAATDLVLRLSKVVGDRPDEQHLLSEWYQCVQSGKPIRHFDGQVLSPTYVQDIAQGILISLEKGLSGLYNMANSEFFLREELARQFMFALGKQVDNVTLPEETFGFSEARAKRTYLDSTKFNKTVGMRFTSMREVFNLFMDNTRESA